MPVSESGKPLMKRKPDSASQTDAKPPREAQGPDCPYPLTRAKMRSGLYAWISDGASPHFSSAGSASRQNTTNEIGQCLHPGLKFSKRTSLLIARSFTSLMRMSRCPKTHLMRAHCLPSFIRISIVTLFLFLPRLLYHGLTPSSSSSRQTRTGSPAWGVSTLMTSAPKCLLSQSFGR